MGDMYIQVAIREKKLRLPFVFETEDKVKEISRRVDKYKEEDIEKKIETDIIKNIDQKRIEKVKNNDTKL